MESNNLKKKSCSSCSSSSEITLWVLIGLAALVFIIGIILIIYFAVTSTSKPIPPPNNPTKATTNGENSSFGTNPLFKAMFANGFSEEKIVHYPKDVCMPYQKDCLKLTNLNNPTTDSLQVAYENWRNKNIQMLPF